MKKEKREIMKNTCNWKPSSIFPNYYLVSDNGEVKSIRTGKILRPSVDKNGYLIYVLCVSGERITVKGHRLVAETFIPNIDKKPCIDHINGIKSDNRAKNLRWVTHKENSLNPITLPKLRRNAFKNIPKLQKESQKRNFGRNRTIVYKNEEIIGVFESQKAASIFTGVCQGKVSQSAKNNTSCKGYKFKTEKNNAIRTV